MIFLRFVGKVIPMRLDRISELNYETRFVKDIFCFVNDTLIVDHNDTEKVYH